MHYIFFFLPLSSDKSDFFKDFIFNLSTPPNSIQLEEEKRSQDK